VIHAQEVPRPAGIRIPSSAIIAIHRARRDSMRPQAWTWRRRHLLGPHVAGAVAIFKVQAFNSRVQPSGMSINAAASQRSTIMAGRA
jgi:hypothetical protein